MKQILIIGGGVIGLCAAYYCAQRGHAVIVIEREGPRAEGCSFGNAGMIVPSHFIPLAAPGMVALGLKWMWNPESPFHIQPRWSWELFDWGWKFYQAARPAHVARSRTILRDLHLASRTCYEELAARWDDDFGLTKKGLLLLCKRNHTLEEEAKTAEQARQLGMPAQVLEAKQAAALDPGVRMDMAGAIYYPLDCHFDPARFLGQLRQELEAMGVSLRYETEATAWRVRGARVAAVKTQHEELAADEFVVAGGAWSPLLARELNLHLPLQAGRGYSLTLAHPRSAPQICAIFAEARIAVTPLGRALRFGGTIEMVDLKEKPHARRVRGMIKAIPHYYPDFSPSDFEGLEPWHGLRPCSPDGLPYLGRTARYGNLTLATGHAMMGMSLGAITGQIVAAIASDENPGYAIELLNPDRYLGKG